MNALLFFSLILILFNFTISASVYPSKKSKPAECQFPAFASENGTCQDPTPICESIRANSVFNSEYKKCILPVGTPCSPKDLNGNPRVACPPNGYCNPTTGTCECEELFTPNGNYYCVRGMPYGTVCDFKEDVAPKLCGVNEGFECRNGKCICEEGRFWSESTDSCVKNECVDRGEDDQLFYDRKTQRCYLELGKERGYYLLRYLRDNLIYCPAHSHIEEWGSETWEGPPVGRCICDKGFHQSINRRECLRNKLQGENCDLVNGDSCDAYVGLSCQRGHCECQYAIWDKADALCYSKQDCKNRDLDSYFDRNATKCFMQIGRSCGLMSSVKCPPNSSCRIPDTGDDMGLKCVCDSHYAPAVGREGCVREKMYGEDCSGNAKNGILRGDPCSPASKLTCLSPDGVTFTTCGCTQDEIWNAKDNVCNLREGEKCERNVRGAMQCTKNSVCEPRAGRAKKGGNNYCTCKPGYKKDFKGRCVGSEEDIVYTKCLLTSDCKTNEKVKVE